MPLNWSFIAVVVLLILLKAFWDLYQAYSKQRLRRRLRDIHRKP